MRRRRGSNAVEFALLMPVFAVATWGLVELSWLSFRQGAAAEAVDQGCRSASLVDPGRREADAQAVLDAARTGILELYDPECSTCVAGASFVGAVPQRTIQCWLEADHRALTQLLGDLSQVGATSTMRLEFQRRSE